MSDQFDQMFAAMDAPPAPKPDAYDTLLSNMDKANNVVATQNVLGAQGTDPDKEAQALQISRNSGVPQPAVSASLASYKQQAQTQSNVQAIDENPNLASFVANNPLAARLASDDFQKLGFLEKAWTAIKSGSSEALEGNALGRFGFQKQLASAVGAQTPDVDQKIQELGKSLQSQPSLTGGFGMAQRFTGFATGLLDNLIVGGGTGAATGAVAGAAGGSVAGGVGAIPGALAGAATGAEIGFNADMATIASGNAYLKMSNIRGSDGQPLSEGAKQFGALFTGVATYALGKYGVGVEANTFGATADKLAQSALDEALTRPTFTKALTDFGLKAPKALGQGALIMGAMEGSAVLGEEMAKAMSAGHFDTDPKEIVSRLADAAINGALMLGASHMAMHGMGLYGDMQAASRADQNAQMFKNLMDGATQSKLRDRDTQAFQDFMQHQTDGSPAENIYIDADKVREMYQSANIDPNQQDRTQDPLFGFVKDMPQQLQEAAQTGGDVVIPSADYVTHLAGTPVSEKLMPDIRIGANAMSVNEAKTFNEQYQMRLKAATDIASQQDETPNPTQGIFNDVQKQAQDAGYSNTEATQYAGVYASRYAARAERLGVDPMEAYQKSGVSVLKGEVGNGDVLQQPERGSIKLSDGKAIISLFKEKDRSTLIHETGHLWLDELGKDAQIDGAPQQLRDDLGTTLKWLGADKTDNITTEQHEQFARAVEAYFMEGKAPSKGLAAVFSRFKTWLTKIYQNVSNLKTPINDDIRGVFDRMLATDSEIEQARQNQGLAPAFKSKEEAGMTSAEWKSYTAGIDKANQQAESTMLDKAMKGVRRQRTAEYKEQLTDIKEKASKQVDARPDIKALTLLTKGTLDGEKIESAKLNRSDVERLIGKDGMTDLPRGVMSADGAHPDAIAEMLGYQSGDTMIKDLQSLEKQQREARLEAGEKRGIRQILIDQQADQEMQEKHGDIMDEQSMQDEAMAAIHSEGQTELLATELRYLKRMGGQGLVERGQGRRAVKEYATKADWDAAEADLINQIKQAKTEAKIDALKQKLADLNMADRWNQAEANTTQSNLREAVTVTRPMLDAIRAHVDAILSDKTTGEIGNFDKYSRDERKAAREVQDAILKKDWNAAAAAKQRQILANILYVKAKDASAEVDRGTGLMQKMAAKKSIDSISQEYLNQIHDLIGRFGFDSKRGEELQRTKDSTLEDFVTKKSQDEGIEMIVDQSLFGTTGGRVDGMKLSAFRALDLAVRSMREVGISDKIITVDGERRDFRGVRDAFVAAIRALGEREKSDYLNPKSVPFWKGKKESMFSAFRSIDASLVKKESLFDQIDQNDPHGIANMAILKKLKDGQHNRDAWSEATAKDFKAAADAMPKGWLKRLRDPLPIDASLRDPETGAPTKIARKDMLGMMLNWGNEGNRTRLADGYNWDQGNVKAFLDRNATKDDWDFVQRIWDAYDKYKDPLDQLQQRVTGIGLDMVHADPFDTPHGSYEGGYYPIVEDKSRTYRAESNSEKAVDAMFPNGYTRATTAHGNTISRVGGTRPISIDLDIAPWKIGQTIHDIAMREAIMDADRLLNDTAVKKAMDDVFGPEYRKMMRPWLQNMANSRNIDDAAMGFWNRVINIAKTNTVIVGIGFRPMTMIKHGTTALSNSISELGAKWMLAGTKEFYGPGMAEKWEFIKSKSPDMAYRLKHYDQDVGGQYANLFKDSAFTKFQQQAQYFGHIGISYLDLGSAAPTWLGAYRKGLAENMSDDESVYFADKTVRNAHGGQGLVDKAAIQEVKGPMQLATMFYGFFNHIYNRQRSIAIQGAQGVASLKAGDYRQATSNFGSVLARSWYYVAVPALIEAMAGTGGPNQDKDETWAGWAAKAITSEIPAGIPILRDIAKAAVEGRDYEMSPVARAVNTIIQSGRDIYKTVDEGEAPENAGQHVAEGIGYATGLPTAAPFTAGKFLWNYNDGSVDPKNLSDWIQGLLHGKLKD